MYKCSVPVQNITPPNSIFDIDFYSNNETDKTHKPSPSSTTNTAINEPLVEFSLVTDLPAGKTSNNNIINHSNNPMDLRDLVSISKVKLQSLGSHPQVVNNFATDIRKACLISRMLNHINNTFGNDFIFQDEYYAELGGQPPAVQEIEPTDMSEITSSIIKNTQSQLSNYSPSVPERQAQTMIVNNQLWTSPENTLPTTSTTTTVTNASETTSNQNNNNNNCGTHHCTSCNSSSSNNVFESSTTTITLDNFYEQHSPVHSHHHHHHHHSVQGTCTHDHSNAAQYMYQTPVSSSSIFDQCYTQQTGNTAGFYDFATNDTATEIYRIDSTTTQNSISLSTFPTTTTPITTSSDLTSKDKTTEDTDQNTTQDTINRQGIETFSIELVPSTSTGSSLPLSSILTSSSPPPSSSSGTVQATNIPPPSVIKSTDKTFPVRDGEEDDDHTVTCGDGDESNHIQEKPQPSSKSVPTATGEEEEEEETEAEDNSKTIQDSNYTSSPAVVTRARLKRKSSELLDEGACLEIDVDNIVEDKVKRPRVTTRSSHGSGATVSSAPSDSPPPPSDLSICLKN